MSRPPATAQPAALDVRTEQVADPGDLLTLPPGPECVAWVRRGQGLVGWGEAARVDLGTGPDRLRRAAEHLRQLHGPRSDAEKVRGGGLRGFVSVTFDSASGGSVLIVPEVLVHRRDGQAWVTTVGGADPPALRPHAVPEPGRIRYAGASVPELRWLESVDRAVRAIAAGELNKVVLARDLRVWSSDPLDVRALLRRLARRFPDCYTFACAGLVGATPELLLRKRGDDVASLVLAGSAPRDADPVRDAALGEGLRASPKEQDEHRFAVESVRDALAPVCTRLDVASQPGLLRLDNVQHLSTALRGRLAAPLGAADLAARLHPTAAVGGAPRAAALRLIAELEGLDRGRYAAPVGWIDPAGDGELGIALRCADVVDGRARLFAGAGIVRASLPEVELEETRLKLRAMQSALEG